MSIQKAIPEACAAALSKAKIRLMSKPDSAFYTTICFSMKHVFSYDVPTADTDGRTCRYNPDYFLAQTPEVRTSILLHETMHPAYGHLFRRGSRDHERFNVACDHVINLQMKERGYSIPDSWYCDPIYTGLSAEKIYDLLPVGTPCNKNLLDILEPADEDDGLKAEIEEILVRASLQSQMAGDKPGSIPGDLQIFLDKLLKPQLSWQRILQKYMQTFAKNDYTFKRPNRRYFPKHHLPSLHSEALIDLAMATDTSGSVSNVEFSSSISEVSNIFRMMKPSKVTMLQFDVVVKAVDEVHNIKELQKLTFTGLGGTRIEPVLEWAEKNKPQVLLIFSDGGFYFYRKEFKIPVIWLIYNNPNFKAPFGKVIHYTIPDA